MKISITHILSIVCSILLLASCNYSYNKQFEEAKQCYDNNESEAAIQLLVLINNKSPHYAEAQQMLKQSYASFIDSLWTQERYDDILSIVDTISPKSCYFGRAQFIIPITQMKKIVNADRPLLTEQKDFEKYNKCVQQLQYMVDTITKDADLIDRKEMYIRGLSFGYLAECYYYIKHTRYEDALVMLDKVNPEVVFSNNVGNYDSLWQGVETLLYLHNRENDIELIHKKTIDIGRSDYFSTSNNYRCTVYEEINEFRAFWEFINKVEGNYHNDQKVMPEIAKLKSEVVRVQKREFPIMRKRYAKSVSEQLWINDIDVNCSGNGNTVINFIGGEYAARANVADTQDKNIYSLKKLRFKKSVYYWCKGFESTHSYNIDSQNDGDPVF